MPKDWSEWGRLGGDEPRKHEGTFEDSHGNTLKWEVDEILMDKHGDPVFNPNDAQMLDAYLARIHVTSEHYGTDVWLTLHGPDITDDLIESEVDAAFDEGDYGIV